MRNLTEEEIYKLSKLKNDYAVFINDAYSILSDFAIRLNLQEPYFIIRNPDNYIKSISVFLENQIIKSDDLPWIVTRIGFFIGEYLNCKLGGCWYVNEWPDTRYFLRYVVGRFSKAKRKTAMIDPFEAAHGFLKQPIKRDFLKFVLEIEKECLR